MRCKWREGRSCWLSWKLEPDRRLSHSITGLLLGPDEVLSRIAVPAILEVGDEPFRGSVEHRHVLVGRLA